jgi:hypothetical protein
MDLIPEEQRDKKFSKRQKVLEDLSDPMKITCFKTSIWDETLYKVPQKKFLRQRLGPRLYALLSPTSLICN